MKVASTARTYISYSPTGAGCSTDGPLNFVSGTSTNKCASPLYFYLQANTRMSSLGSQLVNNWKGGFWACGLDYTVRFLYFLPSPHPADLNADLLQLRRGRAFRS
jgi:hypothetical protein